MTRVRRMRSPYTSISYTETWDYKQWLAVLVLASILACQWMNQSQDATALEQMVSGVMYLFMPFWYDHTDSQMHRRKGSSYYDAELQHEGQIKRTVVYDNNRIRTTASTTLKSDNTFKQSSSSSSSQVHAQKDVLCSRNQVRDGHWIPVLLDHPPYISRTTHLQCHSLEHYKKSPFQYYQWQPNSKCQFTQWNPVDFCKSFLNTTVTVIGDSLSWEQYSSLLQLLRERVHQGDQHLSRDKNVNHVQKACLGYVKIVWRNDAYLQHLQESIDSNFPNVIILNRGAHVVSDDELLHNLQTDVLPVLQEWQQDCMRMQHKHCLAIWRTTVPGTPNCNNTSDGRNLYIAPDNNHTLMHELVHDMRNYNNATRAYQWYEFSRQNELVVDFWHQQQHDVSVEIMDAYDLNILRPDSHRAHQGDCLHNCYPGKMDVYNQLLLHIATRAREEKAKI